MCRSAILALSLCATLAVGCGDDAVTGGDTAVPSDTTATADTATDTTATADTATADTVGADDTVPAGDTSAEAVPLIGEALPCGHAADAGGLPAGNDLVRVPIDTSVFPNALCNDGSTPQIYVRPYEGEENKDRWIIQLKGGGACSTPKECAQRWCSVLTNFGKTQMVGDIRNPPRSGIGGTGILERIEGEHSDDNPFGKFNQVYVNYCSSDTWSGTIKDKVVDTFLPCEPGAGSTCPDGSACPATGDDAGVCVGTPVRYRIHFLGHEIVDAVFATLRRDGVPALSDGTSTMPDLDDAAYVVFAGASAGGAGVTNNLDRIAGVLRDHNTACQGGGSCPLVVEGLIDSIFKPTYEGLNLEDTDACQKAGACTFEAVLRLLQLGTDFWGGVGDESCETWHAAHSGDGWRCTETAHVISHHLTTPFFLRMGLADQLLGGNFVELKLKTASGDAIDSILDFATLLQPQLEWFSTWSDEAEEATDGARAPGVFGPGCSKHETLQSHGAVYETTIAFRSEGRHFFDVWQLWKAGTSPVPVVLVADTPQDSVCVDE